MAMSAAYLNAVRDHGQSLITHVALVDDTDAELTGGGYTRQAVTWTDPSDGVSRPSADLDFVVPAGATVGGWRGFSAATGGVNYGGADLTEETYTAAGTYRLLAASTGVTHTTA